MTTKPIWLFHTPLDVHAVLWRTDEKAALACNRDALLDEHDVMHAGPEWDIDCEGCGEALGARGVDECGYVKEGDGA